MNAKIANKRELATVPVTCEFNSEKKLIAMVVDGQISVSELVSGYQDALQHEQF